MNAKFERDQKIYQCRNCERMFATETAFEDAEKCCICPDCGKPKGHKNGNTQCEECMHKSWAETKAKKIKKAETVKYNPNLVYHNDNEHWYHDEDELYSSLEDCLADKEDLPEYVFVSNKIEGFSLDAYNIVENAVIDIHHEDAVDKIDVNGLQEILDKWCSKQEVVSWSGEIKQKVLVDDIIKEQGWEFEN